MGSNRNGARSFLDLCAQACKMSRMPGFRAGLNKILGAPETSALLALWEPFCAAIDLGIALDNWYNKRDYVNDDAEGEDTDPGI